MGTPHTAAIEIHAVDLARLFNAVDPSPLAQRDLDPRIETYIIDSGQDLSRHAALQLLVHLDQSVDPAADTALLANAVPRHFRDLETATRRQLRLLFGRGRVSLAIGLSVLTASVGINELLANWLPPSEMVEILRQSLLIGGWVAMWTPMEIFLYRWWPIRAQIRLYRRLATMPIRVHRPQTAT